MNVIKYKNLFIGIGLALMALSVVILLTLGLRPGIDFTGGSLTEVTYETRPEKATLESAIDPLSLGEYSLRQASEGADKPGYILRTRDLSDEEYRQVEEALLSAGQGGEITRFTSIGPVIGQELQDKAKWAVGGVTLIIVIYVALAFLRVRWPVGSAIYGLITIISLIHDVLLPAALMSLLGYLYGMEVDILFVMALLAVLGYSVNDTIVIFDRVRENIVKFRQEHKHQVTDPGGLKREEVSYSFNRPFGEIVNLSINETLSRSINTSLTTGLALVALYFFGSEVTRNFALVMLAGVLAGAYSSIFFASPLLVWYADRKEAKQNKG